MQKLYIMIDCMLSSNENIMGDCFGEDVKCSAPPPSSQTPPATATAPAPAAAFNLFSLFENNNSAEFPKPFDFKLPVEYLDETEIFDLSPTVAADLELTCADVDASTIYDIVLNNDTVFGETTKPLWGKKYTTNVDFLCDTQKIITKYSPVKDALKTDIFKNKIFDINDNYEDNNKIFDAYSRIKENENFLAQYNYIEWDCFKYLNKNTSFLHCLSMLNVFSPIVSLIIPFLFLLFPFLFVTMSGEAMTFENYLSALKGIAKNHFIGKLLSVVENQSASNIMYVLLMGCFFFVQIYQNTVTFQHYCKNMCQLNNDLILIKEFVDYTIGSIEAFLLVADSAETYLLFCNEARLRLVTLKEMREMLKDVQPVAANVDKLNELGSLLHKYYELYDNPKYGVALQYSFAFCGFADNVCGIYDKLAAGIINSAEFYSEDADDDVTADDDTDNDDAATADDDADNDDAATAVDDAAVDVVEKTPLIIEKQYYPPHYCEEDNCIKNDCNMQKNMIITGVNASGKTTQLKTTTINIIFTQQFGCGFYERCKIKPYTHIHSYLNIPDTSGRDSLFQAESRRCKEILDIIKKGKPTARHFCIFDELYSGTNATDAKNAAFAFLTYLAKYENVDFILTTHYTELCRKFIDNENIENYRMIVVRDADDGKLKYKYLLERGICKMRGGIDILRQMDYPEEILAMV